MRRDNYPRLVILFACFLACTTNVFGQTGPTVCRLTGLVKRAGTNAPIAKVDLHIEGESIPDARYDAASDGGGNFLFSRIECGRYHLFATRNGYVPKRFNASLFELRNLESVVDVKQGDATPVVVEMLANPAIVGKIVDSDGEPMRGIEVAALSHRYARGKQLIVPLLNATGVSNDLGEYRIVDLPPGDYYLRAYMRTPVEQSSREQTLQARRYAETFYPGTTDVDGASPVHAAAGDETRADITLARANAVSIRGTVVGSEAGESMIMLLPKGAVMSGVRRARTEAGGFAMSSVPQGKYWLLAVNIVDYSTNGIPVEVGSQDIRGLEVSLRKAYDIDGKVTVHSAKKDPFFSGIVVDLESRDEHYTSFFPSNAEVGPNGRFAMSHLPPAHMRVTGGTQPGYTEVENYYLEDAKVGGRSVLEDGFDMGVLTSPIQLEVVMNDGGARLDGTVTDESGKPFPQATVVLVPETHKQRLDLYPIAVADQSGRFSIPGIAPGDYKLYAWENTGTNPVNEESAPYLDPNFVANFVAKGTPLSLKARARETKTVKVIRMAGE